MGASTYMELLLKLLGWEQLLHLYYPCSTVRRNQIVDCVLPVS